MVEFRSRSFFYFLVGVLGVSIVIGLMALASLRWVSAILFLVTFPVLYFVWTRHKWTRPVVKLWSVFMMAGGYGFFRGRTDVATSYSALVLLILGAAVYWLSGKYILTQTEVEVLENS